MFEAAHGGRNFRRLIRWRRWLAVSGLLAGACLFPVAAAGDPASNPRAIRAVGDQNYPPSTYLENGSPRGFDVDVLQALGEAMDRNIQVELMPWDLAQREVREGKAEILTGMSVTEERKKLWDFATPTLTRSFSLFVAGKEVTIHGVDDLQGKRVGVTAGGLPGDLLRGKPGLTLVLIPNYEEGFELLTKGGVDAIAADSWVAGYTLVKYRIKGVVPAGAPFATLDSSIAVRRGNRALLQEINRGLEKLRQHGTIESIRQKWEPKQIVYFLKEDVREYLVLAALVAGAVLLAGLAAWCASLKKEVKARKKVESRLRTSEGLLNEIAGNVPEIFWLREIGGEQIPYVNSAWEHITGYPPPKTRSDFLRAVHPDDIDRVRSEALRSPLGGVDHQYRIVRPDGSVRWLHVRTFAVRNGAGEIYRIAGIGTDVTEDVSRGQQLRQFRAAVDASADLVTLIDPRRMRYVDINDATCRTLGYSREELLAMSLDDVFSVSGLDLGQSYSGLIVGDQVSSSVEGIYRRKDGSTFPVEAFRHVVASDEGDIIVAVARDITARKETEEKIRRLNRTYAVLSGINALIVRVRGRDELFRETCRIVVEAGQFRMAWVGVVNRETMKVTPVAWGGAAEGYLDSMPPDVKREIFEGRSLTGRAVREKTAVISNDVQNDEDVVTKKQFEERGINSLAVMPLLVGGTAVGVLCMYAREFGFFDDDEMKLLLELAGDISFALDYVQNQEKLDYLAYYDSLTGLPNRTLFLDRLSQPLHAKDAWQSMFALVLIDIVRFRVINDTLGRQAGDELLRLVAQRLGAPQAGYDPPARVGVNCFAIELHGMRDPAEIAHALEGIVRSGFGEPFQVQGTELRVAAKCGVALFPSDGGDADTLIRNTEAALARAKQSADTVMFYAPAMNARVSEVLAMENKLRKAIELGQFVLHYQPKVDLADRRIVGVEALIRWQDPEVGLVPPGRFIPLLEETGMIFEVGRWAMQQAVAEHRVWASKGFVPPRVAVNVSPLQLRYRDFVGDVERAAKSGTGAASGLDLEITESVIMEDIGNTIAKLRAVHDLGVNIAIDDFGTGYSSLSYLAKLPVTTLKIDRSFIVEMTQGSQGLAIVATIINLAHSLNLKVVAEGVETEEQSKILKRLECDQIQGYLFSKPVPGDQIEVLLARSSPPARRPQVRRDKKSVTH